MLPPLEIVPEYRGLVPALQAARVSPEPQDMDGSNNWVVSGRLSPTGVPIVSNDPHRTIEMPSLRYFVHLVSPGWNVIGGGEPPFVGVDAGSNDRMAWGFTFAGIDMVDTFVEETNPADPNQTRYNGRVGADADHPRGNQGERRGRAAHRRAEVHPARTGVLRGHGEPPRLRGEVGEPGAGHGARSRGA